MSSARGADGAPMKMPRRVLHEHDLRMRQRERQCDQEVVLRPRANDDIETPSPQSEKQPEKGWERLVPVPLDPNSRRERIGRRLITASADDSHFGIQFLREQRGQVADNLVNAPARRQVSAND